MSNTFGKLFTITTFGESHGPALGVIIDGYPAGLKITEADIQKELDRRKPGQSAITTSREEDDKIRIMSGITEGKTTGAPIMLIVENRDARSKDYGSLKEVYRPGHADFTYEVKYGHREWRGGGRASARTTLAQVAAGAIAKKYLKEKLGVEILGFVDQVGDIKADIECAKVSLKKVEANPIRCPDEKTAKEMIKLIIAAKADGDSVGGAVAAVIRNVPAGLGSPVFDKLPADLAKAMMGINAAKGFEIGSGFGAAKMRGSEHNDSFYSANGQVKTKTNFAGGTLGGISTGEDIYFRVAFKPTSTISKAQDTIDRRGKKVILKAAGRHDPCIVPRAVPIVEAMAALVVMDHYLRWKAYK
ncbi:MAG: chorismate synthase [Patescibacteria group bacterium]|jgi:chorismate synthase